MSKTKSSSNIKSILAFGGFFFVLHFLLFLPVYLSHYEITSFFPSTELKPDGFLSSFLPYFMRDNLDMFRFNGEWIFALLLPLFFYNGKWIKRLCLGIMVLLYWFLFSYQCYYEISIKLFGTHPYFKNDWILSKEVLSIFLNEVSPGGIKDYLLAALALILCFATLFFLVKYYLHFFWKFHPSRASLFITGFTIALTLFVNSHINKKNYQEYKRPYSSLQWLVPKVKKSMSLKGDGYQNLSNKSQYADYLQYEFTSTPDVYLIFIEAYGAVAAADPEDGQRHQKHVSEMSNRLSDKGWKSASCYSKSTVMGGRSWMAFTSSITGLHIENQIQFNTLLQKHSDYPHMVRFFNNLGYQTVRMKTMANTKASTRLSYELSDRFYDFDQWIKYDDIPYKGFKYDYFGGLPDQYALNFAEEEVLSKYQSQPTFLFFITMSSHYPFYPVPTVLENWRELDKIVKNPYDKFLSLDRDKTYRYFDAITYELEILEKFILQQGDENDIFILIGDHQPATLEYMLEGKIDPFATPLHIISKDSTFVKSFYNEGLKPGLHLNPIIDNKKLNHHEGLYSLLVRQLVLNYGKDTSKAPPFLPKGIDTNN